MRNTARLFAGTLGWYKSAACNGRRRIEPEDDKTKNSLQLDACTHLFLRAPNQRPRCARRYSSAKGRARLPFRARAWELGQAVSRSRHLAPDMARRGRAPALQVLPSYTEEDLLKETGRLLQESKQLREQVATHWQIKPEQWQKTLADSADAVKQYTRWSVTGPAVEQMTKRPLPGDNSWKAAKQVRAPTGCSHRLRRAPSPPPPSHGMLRAAVTSVTAPSTVSVAL
jgi:hypothetical protein